MIRTGGKHSLTYRQVLEYAKALSPADQQRLRAELAKPLRVYMIKPDVSPDAVRRGRQLAAQIRKQMSENRTGSLDDTMRRLRGRSWS
jgi:hypothetical protein